MSSGPLGRDLPVLVVGGGVSGCACAAVLAAAGRRVVLINGALDSVGMPGYGPEVVLGNGAEGLSLGQVFSPLPQAFSQAWLVDAREPDLAEAAQTLGGRGERNPGDRDARHDPNRACFTPEPPFVLIERRAVSVRVKWLLEGFPGLELRQGVVTGLKAEAPLEVQTSFGENIEGCALILAVGLSLGGLVHVGDQVLSGGRYGEVGAEALRECLVGLGQRLFDRSTPVGRRLTLLSNEAGGAPDKVRAGPALGPGGAAGPQRWLRLGLRPLAGGGSGRALQSSDRLLPGRTAVPSPYDLDGEPDWWLLAPGSDPEAPRGIFPDGAATGLWYMSPGLQAAPPSGYIEAQPEQRVTGSVFAPDSAARPGVRRVLPNVWAAGQVAGAQGYLESLAAGAQAASQVLTALGKAGSAH
jgi:hypothetical protein